jgi:hypothetical protein
MATASFGAYLWQKGENIMRRLIVILFLGLVLALPCTASAAVFNNARDYIPAPPNTLVVMSYYEHVSAQYDFLNGHKVTNDLGLTENIGLLRPIYFAKLGPFIIDPNVIIPFGSAAINQGSGLTAFNTSSSGMGDPLWICTFWLLHNDKSKFYVGVTPIMITPLGTYNSNKAINLGSNRWSWNIQGNVTKGWEVIPGHSLYVEGNLQGQFYTNNNRAFNPGVLGHRIGHLSQDPEIDCEGHLSYDITKTVFAAVDYYGAFGGRQNFENISLQNSQATSTIGGTLAYSFAPGFQLMLQYKGDVAVNSGPQTNTILFRFLWATDFKALKRAMTQ